MARKLAYNSTYGRLLGRFLGDGWNVRINKYYVSKHRGSRKWEWYWHDVEFDERFFKMHKRRSITYPTISTSPCDGHTYWLLGNMVKYGLLRPRKKGGFAVTPKGRAFYKDYLAYMEEIRGA